MGAVPSEAIHSAPPSPTTVSEVETDPASGVLGTQEKKSLTAVEDRPPEKSDQGAQAPPPLPKTGTLEINVRPWAYVYVDGKEMGMTPLEPLELMVGEHVVLVKNRKLAEERSFRILIKANEVISKNVNLLNKE